VEEVFSPQMLSNAKSFEVHNLKSGYLKKSERKIHFVPFSNDLQVAPINCFVKSNFDSDKKNLFSRQEIILVCSLSQ
jgi:hypothetical protein